MENGLSESRSPWRDASYYVSEAEFAAIPAAEFSDPARLCQKPLVSVALITYNHAPYIAQSIESILAQETDFEWELLIGEDCSSDSTLAICRRYLAARPDRIRLISGPVNVGGMKNLLRLFHRARGKYQAELEGDDYWCDPRKLDKQVRYLEANPDVVLCGTGTRVVLTDRQGREVESHLLSSENQLRTYTLDQALSRYLFHASTYLFRREVIRYPRWFYDFLIGDKTLLALLGEQGGITRLPDVTTVYRIHEGGVWSAGQPLKRYELMLEIHRLFFAHFDPTHHAAIRESLIQGRWANLHELAGAGRLPEARAAFWEALPLLKGEVPATVLLQGWMHAYLPRFYEWLRNRFKRT